MQSLIVTDATLHWVARGRRVREIDFPRFLQILALAERDIRECPLARTYLKFTSCHNERWALAGRLLHRFRSPSFVHFMSIVDAAADIDVEEPAEVTVARRQVYMRYAEEFRVARWENLPARSRGSRLDESRDW